MFQNTELNSSKIDRYSLIEQSENCSNYKKALKCIAHRPESNMLKICPKCFQEFPLNFTYYASQSSYYVCIMLLSCQQFSALTWKILSNDCSIKVFHYKVTVLLESIDLRRYLQCIWVLFLQLNISLTALLESIDLF